MSVTIQESLVDHGSRSVIRQGQTLCDPQRHGGHHSMEVPDVEMCAPYRRYLQDAVVQQRSTLL